MGLGMKEKWMKGRRRMGRGMMYCCFGRGRRGRGMGGRGMRIESMVMMKMILFGCLGI